MKLIYIAFARMPTEKAHGLTIAKSCESFAHADAEVTLFVPKRKTKLTGDPFSTYGLKKNFSITEVTIPDLIGHFGESRMAFYLHYILFYIAVALRLLMTSRNAVLYTREAPFCLLSWIGYRVALEPHQIASHKSLYFFFARRARWLFPISKALKDAFVAAGFDEKRMLVAPSGVDLSVFDIDISKENARRQLDLPLGAKIAVYTGNFTTMEQDKGLHDSIVAIKNTPGITLVAVGGSKKDIDRYSREARDAGVGERVLLRGYEPQKKLAVYQKAADVLLMPFPDTPHYRNHMSPVKMFEYMASGVPIIASDLPTIREVLDEQNAFIVSPGDPDAIAEALDAAVNDRVHAASRARYAKTTVQAYDWDGRSRRIVEQILDPA